MDHVTNRPLTRCCKFCCRTRQPAQNRRPLRHRSRPRQRPRQRRPRRPPRPPRPRALPPVAVGARLLRERAHQTRGRPPGQACVRPQPLRRSSGPVLWPTRPPAQSAVFQLVFSSSWSWCIAHRPQRRRALELHVTFDVCGMIGAKPPVFAVRQAACGATPPSATCWLRGGMGTHIDTGCRTGRLDQPRQRTSGPTCRRKPSGAREAQDCARDLTGALQ